jgi:hypothetical protein
VARQACSAGYIAIEAGTVAHSRFGRDPPANDLGRVAIARPASRHGRRCQRRRASEAAVPGNPSATTKEKLMGLDDIETHVDGHRCASSRIAW